MKSIENELRSKGLDVVEYVEIPNHGDRMVRIRTLEDAISDFDSSDSDSVSYLVRARPIESTPVTLPPISPKIEKNIFSQLAEATFAHAQTIQHGIYKSDGQLNIPYLFDNAKILFDAGDYSLARNIYKTISQAGEKTGTALFWIARCYEMEKSFPEACKFFEESIAYQPTLETFQHLAALLIRLKKDQEAAEIMERALTIKDMSTQARFELHRAAGNSWLRSQKLDQAQEHYLRAIELNPNSDQVESNLGALYFQLHKIDVAKRHFNQALALNSKNDRALSGLGSCHLAEGDYRAAHDYFARSLSVNLNNPTSIYHLVKSAYEIKSYATSVRLLEEYIRIAPINANLLYTLAGLQFHLGRMQDSRSTLDRIIEIQPAHSGALDLMSRIEKYAGNQLS